MSQTRQIAFARDEEISIRSLSLGLPPALKLAGHTHPWPQFVYATAGVLTVTAVRGNASGTWVVPSHRAVWIPGDIEHRFETTGEVFLRTLYLRPGLAPSMPEDCCVMGVTPLLRELVLETVARGMLKDSVPEEARLARVLADQLNRTPEVPLDLTWPRDPRARRVADAVCADLSANISLARLAHTSGASVRTLERLFVAETGTTFAHWRQRARLLEALRQLAAGESVTAVALAVGYESTSAFVAMFKTALGTTPGAYF